MKRMRKKAKRVLTFILLFGMLISSMDDIACEAASDTGYMCYYKGLGDTERQEGTIGDAWIRCYQCNGGEITVTKNCCLETYDNVEYTHMGKNTTFTLAPSVKLTVGARGLKCDGTIYLCGATLDLVNSAGELTGEGQVIIVENVGGNYYRRTMTMNKFDEEVAFTATDIVYGEPLSKAKIVKDNVYWIGSQTGTWNFVDEDYVPLAGTHRFRSVYTADKYLTYEELYFDRCGEITVKKAVPKLAAVTASAVHYGEKISEADLEYCFVSPVTGEEVDGELRLKDKTQSADTVGNMTLKADFIPENPNYEEVVQDLTVRVLETTPEVIRQPEARHQGSLGQTLKDIQIFAGKCKNPYTNELIRGTWEWKNEKEKLRLGSQQYDIVFIPEEEGYSRLEQKVELTALPEEMNSVQWPECSDIVYGQSLADSTLSFTKNEYGTFRWEDEDVCPGVKNQGVRVVFTPVSTTIYDWSKVPQYDAKNGTITCNIPIRVKAIPGKLPDISEETLVEGDSLSLADPGVASGSGTAVWKDPEYKLYQSAEHTLCFLPADRDNYIWSDYSPDIDGTIELPVKVNIIPKGTVEKKAVYGQKLQDVPIQMEDPEVTCTWKNPSVRLEKLGETQQEVVYTYRGKSYVRTLPVIVVSQNTQTPETTDSTPSFTPDSENGTGGNGGEVLVSGDGGTVSNADGTQTAVVIPSETEKPETTPAAGIQSAPITAEKTPKSGQAIRQVKIKKVIRRGSAIKITCQKQDKVSYEIQCCMNKKWKKVRKKKFSKPSITIKNLNKKKNYYFRIRAWRKVNKQTIYGKWSKVIKAGGV